MSLCNLCPRRCGADRENGKLGYCGEGNTLRVARIAPHYFEEPCISGDKGSGTVFFSGCSMGCVFCQNKDISRRGGRGEEYTEARLYQKILELQGEGVHNINLVTPTHFVHLLAPLLSRLRVSGDLKIPVVYNSSGYERIETLKMLDGLVDIYMPDFKYFSSVLSADYSNAPDYADIASAAVCEMYRQVGKCKYCENQPQILASGVIVRHLVLPSGRHDSIAVLRRLSELVPKEDILLSLMSQYTPEFALDCNYTQLHRRITSFEYNTVADEALRLGFNGFIQAKSSASTSFTPEF